MAIWMIRAGMHGRYEQKFLQDGRIYVTLPGLSVNLAILPDRDALSKAMPQRYAAAAPRRLGSLVNQIWLFSHEVAAGDMVLLVQARQPAVTVGEVTGDYRFEHAAPDPFYHWLNVNWIARDIPRINFGSDLLLSLSSRLAFCRLARNNAEQRIAAMRSRDWKPEPAGALDAPVDEFIEGIDFEAAARDQTIRTIAQHFSAAGLAELVAAVLAARGYTVSTACDCLPEGCLLAGAGNFGLGGQRLIVQVLMTDGPVDRPALNALGEAAAKAGAQDALLVSWSGFTAAALCQPADEFYRLRLWSAEELLDEVATGYGKLDENIKARLQLAPLLISRLDEP